MPMADSSMIRKVKTLTNADDEVIDIYLQSAKRAILNKLYPFQDMEKDQMGVLPKRYESLAIDICVYLVNKQGGEGETSHSENGVSRHYESAYVPDSMLNAVIPLVKAR